MKTEIIINAATHETRIAILEDGKMEEIWVERPDNERMVGDIYKGKVKAVIPGIQAAFVNIGLEKSAFLHVSDVSNSSIDFAAQYEDDEMEEESSPESVRAHVTARKEGRGNGEAKSREKKHSPIESILTKDQELLVQVTKEPISTKGARLTSQISLPGRFLVLMPGVSRVGVSRKISSWAERKRLRQLALKHQHKGYGLIIRTLAVGKGEDVFHAEIEELVRTYEELLKKAEKTQSPALIHKEMGMTSGIIRDLLGEDVQRVVVDSKAHYDAIRKYLDDTSPNLNKKVTLYEDKEPIFDHFDLEQEIEKISSRKVWLKSGAFLVLDHAEALTVIDVNSGRYIGKSNQEETILDINMESAIEIARQLRLRDIGGIIVIDFIDMASLKHRKKVEDVFVESLINDRSKISISQISEFGLMEMTRQRVRPSLIHTFSETCPTCDGIGMVQARDTTLTKLERWLARAEVFGKEKTYTIFVHPAVFEFIVENDEERLTLLKSSTSLAIDIVVDSKIGIDEFFCFNKHSAQDVTKDFAVGKSFSRIPPASKDSENKGLINQTPIDEFSKKNTDESKFGRKPRPKKRR